MKLLNQLFGTKRTKKKETEEIASVPTSVNEMRDFAIHYFGALGATVTPLDRRKNGLLQVALPDTLAEFFEKPELRLAFQSTDAQNGHELVAYGSRIFDRMAGYLERKSAFTLMKLPNRHPSSEELLHALTFLNTGTRNLKLQEQTQYLFAFDWRITYRADDKREELYTVVMDEMGKHIPQVGHHRQEEPPLDIQALLKDAEGVPPETNNDGEILPPKLPPLTHLCRLAESARKLAIYHADVRCVEHEAEILARLHKVLTRLTSYYQQQIEEVADAHDAEGEKRLTLEQDLERKIAEEVENHRLRVNVELVSYAALQVPVVTAEITIGDGSHEAILQVRRNRYNGALRLPQCHVCEQESARILLDSTGKICCENCAQQCAICLQLVSGEGCTEPCPVCQKENCVSCGTECVACGSRACRDCASVCPVCFDMVCHACQSECAHCHTRQCRSHLRVDSVLGSDGQPQFICAECAVRCPNCKQYSAQIETCCASGQRFCRNCVVVCDGCGRSVGVAFAQRAEKSRKSYCPDCVERLSRA
ncbi:MAG: hypothetical protein U0175_10685 [Caldilineaceae bacterium]